MPRKKILAICGSTRQQSTNHYLIQAIAALYADRMEMELFDGIAHIPHFNPDDDGENPGPAVTGLREQFRAADGILICTPEYAHGVPGSLKNTIDWTVSSSSFSGKPTVLITASTDGTYGHKALLETLKVIEAGAVNDLQLLIPFAKTKVNATGITDAQTLVYIRKLMDAFLARICRNIIQ